MSHYVACKERSGQMQSRAVCTSKPFDTCGGCSDSVFQIRLRTNAGNRVVACPRWDSLGARYAHVKPTYETVRREVCLLKRPFEHCSVCTNKDINNPPEVMPGWWERRWKE